MPTDKEPTSAGISNTPDASSTSNTSPITATNTTADTPATTNPSTPSNLATISSNSSDNNPLMAVSALMASNQHSAAAASIQSALQNSTLSPQDHAWLLYQLGQAHTFTKDYSAAMASYQQAIDSGNLPPELIPKANFQLGHVYANRGEYGVAADHWWKVIREKDGAVSQDLVAQSYYQLGVAYKQSGRGAPYQAFKRSIDTYERYLQDGIKDPTLEALARYHLAMAQYEFGENQSAISNFNTAQQSGHLDQVSASMAQAMGQYLTGHTLYNNDKPHEAAGLLQSAVDSGKLPADILPMAHFMLGQHYYSAKDWEKAGHSFLRATAAGGGLSPQERADAFFGLGATHYESGQYEDAIAPFQSALQSNLLDPRRRTIANFGLGISQFHKGHDKAANQHLGLTLAPQNRTLLSPEMIAEARLIRTNYEQGNVAYKGLYEEENDQQLRLHAILQEIYEVGGKPLDDAGLDRWEQAINQYLDPGSYPLFATLFERTYAEHNKDRGDRSELARNMLPVLDQILHNPTFLRPIADEVQPPAQDVCVNQPMSNFSQVGALVDFLVAAHGNLSNAMNAARQFYGRSELTNWAIRMLDNERRRANDPRLYQGVEVEFMNAMERKVHEKRQEQGLPDWSGVPGVVPYEQTIRGLLTPGNIHDAMEAVRQAENASADKLLGWLMNGPYFLRWHNLLQEIHPREYEATLNHFRDQVANVTDLEQGKLILRQQEDAMRAITGRLTQSAITQDDRRISRSRH